MSSARQIFVFDRFTTNGEVAEGLRRILKKTLVPIFVFLGGTFLFLLWSGHPGALAFGMIAVGSCATLVVWAAGGKGLPLLPLITIQNLVIYGWPIAAGHTDLTAYPDTVVFQGGMEVMTYMLAMAAAWKIGMQVFEPKAPYSHVLTDISSDGLKALNRLGFVLIVASTAFLVLQASGLSDYINRILPQGITSIEVALVAACSACGFFVAALSYRSEAMTPGRRIAFWILFLVNCLISASGFLLSGVIGCICAVAIGLFWGSGRAPWRFLILVTAALAFFNLGKFTMRDRYKFNADDPVPIDTSFAHMPALYLEWSQVSLDELTNPTKLAPSSELLDPSATTSARQSLGERLDNFQNILYIIDAVQDRHIDLLNGQTYFLIPALLIPRIMWPEKPRTHEGQVLLNVHFGRQDIESTFTTYVAWGILPEAYGNFGPIAGAVILGGVLGLCFAWAENFSSRKTVVSLEGILSFGVLFNMLNSFEMVASVLVTSSFQNLLPIAIAFWPFVRRKRVERPAPTSA